MPAETSNLKGTNDCRIGNTEIDFEGLEVRLQACVNPQSLTPRERLCILTHAAETVNSVIADGITGEAAAKRAVADWLAAHGRERSVRSLERDLVRFRKRPLLAFVGLQGLQKYWMSAFPSVITQHIFGK